MVNVRTLDLNLLRVFRELMRTRNVTRTGAVLGLTQPSVSAALARLRAHLGDPLFVRSGNAMVPTDYAEALAGPVAAALDQIAAAFAAGARFDPVTAEATFTLRGADFFSMRMMPVLAGRLAREAPKVSLRFLDSAHGDLWSLLERDEIDVALEQPLETPGWVSRAPLFRSPFVLIAAAGNAAVARAGVAPGETFPMRLFCTLPHALRSIDGSMTGMTDAALAAQGLARRVALALPHFEAIVRTVAQSKMIAVVPVQLATDVAGPLGLNLYRPPLEIPVPTMWLYWHSRHDAAPAQEWLRQRILELTAETWGVAEEAV